MSYQEECIAFANDARERGNAQTEQDWEDQALGNYYLNED